MKLLVTGAGGFVGSAVAREAAAVGHDVVALVRQGTATTRLPSWIAIDRADLGDGNAVFSVLAKHRPDALIHSAWGGVTNRTEDAGVRAVQNVNAACMLADAAAAAGVAKLVGVGSQAEYGALAGRVSENQLPAPSSLYGASKLAAMVMMRQLAARVGQSFAWLRLFSTYGPNDNPSWMIPSIVDQMLDGTPPKTTLGTQLWDYLYIDDVARALVAAATSDAAGVFNLGSGKAVTVRFVVEALRDLVAPGMKLVFGEIPYKADQIWHLEGDITALKAATGWAPQVDLATGLERTVAWHRQKRSQTNGN